MDDADQYPEERPQYAPYAPISAVTGGSPISSALTRNGQEEEAGTTTIAML